MQLLFCVDMEDGLFFEFLDDDGGIVTAKAEGIGERSANGAFLSLVEGEVEIVIDVLVLIAFFMIDSGRNDIFLNRLDAEDSFHSSGGTEEMAGH